MKPGKDVDEWGGSEWEEKTPAEIKQEDGLEDLVKKVRFVRCIRGARYWYCLKMSNHMSNVLPLKNELRVVYDD